MLTGLIMLDPSFVTPRAVHLRKGDHVTPRPNTPTSIGSSSLSSLSGVEGSVGATQSPQQDPGDSIVCEVHVPALVQNDDVVCFRIRLTSKLHSWCVSRRYAWDAHA